MGAAAAKRFAKCRDRARGRPHACRRKEPPNARPWVADLADEGLFRCERHGGVCPHADWRVEADRILATVKKKGENAGCGRRSRSRLRFTSPFGRVELRSNSGEGYRSLE